MSKRDEYTRMMEERLELWNARLESMSTHPELGPKLEPEKLDNWRVRSAALTTYVNLLKQTTGDTWDERKAELDKAWIDLDALLAPVAPEVPGVTDENTNHQPPVAPAIRATPPPVVVVKP